MPFPFFCALLFWMLWLQLLAFPWIMHFNSSLCRTMNYNAASPRFFSQVARMSRVFSTVLLIHLTETKYVFVCLSSLFCFPFCTSVSEVPDFSGVGWFGVFFCVRKPILLGNVCSLEWGLKLGSLSYLLYLQVINFYKWLCSVNSSRLLCLGTLESDCWAQIHWIREKY